MTRTPTPVQSVIGLSGEGVVLAGHYSTIGGFSMFDNVVENDLLSSAAAVDDSTSVCDLLLGVFSRRSGNRLATFAARCCSGQKLLAFSQHSGQSG